jgi:glycosyltransferase involved in cell wall biosynthesis
MTKLICALTFCIWISSAFGTPRVSIITSVYDGDEFIEGFLYDIVKQTIFNECELILINANSPGNEEATIQRFMKHYPNIRYIKLKDDPGIYGVWNMAIQQAQAPYITNANLDDRRNPKCIQIHVQALEEYPEIDLVYSDYCVTYVPNQRFANNDKRYRVRPPEFSLKHMYLCLPGPQPMWRKALHDKYGYFDESFFHSGDLEMWLRAASQGAQFKKIPFISGVYYLNPKGLSTDQNPIKLKRRNYENAVICKKYGHLWSYSSP